MNVGFDMDSYIIGKKDGAGNIVLSGDGFTFTDPDNDGNIVVSKNESEVNDNG